MSIVGNLAALGHSTASDEVVKNTFANFAFEHYEIASYSSLLTLAELAGDTSGAGDPEYFASGRKRNGAMDRGPSGRDGPPLCRSVGGRPEGWGLTSQLAILVTIHQQRSLTS